MKYYNLIQVKENLSDVIDRIEDCKKMADAELFLYRCLVQQCIFETIHPDADYGIWTTKEFMAETWNNYKSHVEEAEYLQSMVDEIKNDSTVKFC